jgi:hypothetical protein
VAGPGPGRMSSAVRGTGVISNTAPTSAIRLRVRTSPRDSRPCCSGAALPALLGGGDDRDADDQGT